jgi:hypothetical protein
MIYRIPIKFALAFQLKAGAGGANVRIKPDNEKQWRPHGHAGFRDIVSGGALYQHRPENRLFFIYESYLPGATRNGHIINSGITLYFNLGGR